MNAAILEKWGLPVNSFIKVYGSGLINNTWLVQTTEKKYILQRINENVFKEPYNIDYNLKAIATWLLKNYPDYIFTAPLPAKDNETLLHTGDGYYRLFNFIENSHSYTVAEKPQLAYEAAKQFGRFTKLLAGFNASQLKTTIPQFHDIRLRYNQFLQALKYGNKKGITKAIDLIHKMQLHKNIVDVFDEIQRNSSFKKRVTHHDSKISNVLFDENDKAICIIDFDTVMPGYFISDVGDIVRTYLPAASEEETDLNKIDVREGYFDAIAAGYLSELQNELSEPEINAFIYAGKFMIYMQALRFLTDYLTNDIYYGSKYELHNYNRAANQFMLLKALIKKEEVFIKKVKEFQISFR